jgi:hypothetical protein
MFSKLYFQLGVHKVRGWTRKHMVLSVALACFMALGTTTAVIAFMAAGGSGAAAYTSQQSIQSAPATVRLTVNPSPSTSGPMAPGATSPDTHWSFGDTQQFVVRVTNTSANPVDLTGLTLSWAVNGINDTATILGPTFTMTSNFSARQLNANGGTASFNATITMNNLATVDQTTLAGQTPTFIFIFS